MIRSKPLAYRADRGMIVVRDFKQQPEKYKNIMLKFHQVIDLFHPGIGLEARDKYVDDMLFCFICYSAYPEEYFIYGFEHLDAEKRDEIMTDGLRYSFYKKVNDPKSIELLDDKYLTYQHFSKYFNRELLLVRSVEDMSDFLDFTSRNPRFIMKPVRSYGGNGIRIVDLAHDDFANVFRTILSFKSGAVVEELVVQSEIMGRLNESSLNTVRVMSAYFHAGVELLYPLLKVGRKGNCVDNFSSGGMIAAVDTKTGRVTSPLTDRFRNSYVSHPDSGVPIIDFQLPDWELACDMTRELAASIPENRIVGWDLAYTRNGWIMIEGNPRPQLGGQLVSDKGWVSAFEDLQERLLREMGTIGR